jgi:tungstate transport system ATP-binding protein
MDTIVDLNNVSLRKGRLFCLKIPHLSIERGSSYALVGQNGAGKTSLLNVMGFLDRVDEGEVVFEGRDVYRMNGQLLTVRRRIGLVMQEPLMFRGTVLDNIAYGLKLRGWKERQIVERVTECLTTIGLDGYADRMARELSGGEIRRVAIARAIAYHPDLLLLDEPTSSVDRKSAEMVEQLITDLREREKTTVVVTTHYIEQAYRMADEVVVLDSGRIAETRRLKKAQQTPTLQQLLSDRHALDRIAQAVVTGERGLGGNFDRIADDVASLLINRLSAVNAPGVGRISHLTWDDPVRCQKVTDHYGESVIQAILMRVEKHLAAYGRETMDG